MLISVSRYIAYDSTLEPEDTRNYDFQTLLNSPLLRYDNRGLSYTLVLDDTEGLGRQAVNMLFDLQRDRTIIYSVSSAKSEVVHEELQRRFGLRAALLQVHARVNQNIPEHGILGFSPTSSLGRGRYALVSLPNSHLVSFLDMPTNRIALYCWNNQLPEITISLDALQDDNKWMFSGLLYADSSEHPHAINVVIDTKMSGIELPRHQYDQFHESLDNLGLIPTGAQGEHSGYMQIRACTGISHANLPTIAITDVNGRIVAEVPGSEYMIRTADSCILAIRLSEREEFVRMGGIFISNLVIVFDAPRERLHMCNRA